LNEPFRSGNVAISRSAVALFEVGRNPVISEGNVVGDIVSRVDESPHAEVMIATTINAMERKEMFVGSGTYRVVAKNEQ
jgi:hypothetical protein